MSDYNKKIKNADIEYVYHSTSPKGEIEQDFKPLNEFEEIKRLKDRISKLEQYITRSDKVIEITLDKLGIERNNRYTNTYLLCNSILNGRVLLDNVEYGMVESLNGYIQKVAYGNIYPKKYLEQFENLLNQCYQEVEGSIELDEEKYNAVMGAL